MDVSKAVCRAPQPQLTVLQMLDILDTCVATVSDMSWRAGRIATGQSTEPLDPTLDFEPEPWPRIPLELLGVVIYHLQDSFEDLKTMSLVHRSCVSPAQLLLFRSVKAVSTAGASMFDWLEIDMRSWPPYLFHAVRNLTLAGTPPSGNELLELIPPKPKSGRIYTTLLQNILRRLPNLKKLTLCNITLRTNGRAPPDASQLVDLQELDLIDTDAYHDGMTDYHSILGLFGKVDTLRVMARPRDRRHPVVLPTLDAPNTPLAPVPHRLAVTHLVLSTPDNDGDLLKMICGTRTMPQPAQDGNIASRGTLNSLDVSGYDDFHLSHLLATGGHTLEHFRFDLSRWVWIRNKWSGGARRTYNSQGIERRLDLRKTCPGLASLTIALSTRQQRQYIRESIGCLRKIVSRAPASLRLLVVEVDLGIPEHAQQTVDSLTEDGNAEWRAWAAGEWRSFAEVVGRSGVAEVKFVWRCQAGCIRPTALHRSPRESLPLGSVPETVVVSSCWEYYDQPEFLSPPPSPWIIVV